MNAPQDQFIADKMRRADVGQPTIAAFLNAVRQVRAGERGMLPESAILPVQSVPALDELGPATTAGQGLLKQLAVIKLNGGLGTSMGLETAKSLIAIKDDQTFLDYIARQVLFLRGGRQRTEPAFYLMNSFATRQESLEHLKGYPDLDQGGHLDFVQSKVPKLDDRTLAPIAWPRQPDLEWCPPGHGDLYPSLLSAGLLDALLARGIRYLFVSNSDNLGATVDVRLLEYFAAEDLPFLMEVAIRTAADRKGGHLARRRQNGRLLLRESAQCPKEDEAAFQDIDRHRFFNTNNLWIRLDYLRTQLDKEGGALPLPLITNTKNVDPKDPASPTVLQLESAMGAAIECFDRSGAIAVPRARFAPVKTTADLLALRSDAYRVTEDSRLILAESRRGQPPVVDLDSKWYKVLHRFDALFPAGPPSLLRCERMTVHGPVQFEKDVVCEGTVEFANPSSEPKVLSAGTYRDTRVQL